MKVRTLAFVAYTFLAVTVVASDSDAGIVRDLMVSIHVAKPPAASAAGLPRKGFACCNLHYSKDWISDANYTELQLIPVGTPIEVLSYGSNRAYVKVDGKPMRLGHDYGRDQESLEAWVNKIVVADDPRPLIATWPQVIQDCIEQGKVMVGMTREQAIASVGYPMTSENISLDAPTWKLWRSSRSEYDLHFKPNGRIGSITGDDDVTSQVIYHPGQ